MWLARRRRPLSEAVPNVKIHTRKGKTPTGEEMAGHCVFATIRKLYYPEPTCDTPRGAEQCDLPSKRSVIKERVPGRISRTGAPSANCTPVSLMA